MTTMIDERQMLRVVAASPTKPGDLIVEDAEGVRRLFIGSTGTLSRGALNPDFVDALFKRQRWEPTHDERWYSLDDLRRAFPAEDEQREHLNPNRSQRR